MVARLLLLALSAAALAHGCGDNCEDLAEVCGNCRDADYKLSCEQTVADRNQRLCSGRLALFKQYCPPPRNEGGGGAAVAQGSGGAASTTGASGGGGASATGGAAGSGGTAGAGG